MRTKRKFEFLDGRMYFLIFSNSSSRTKFCESERAKN